MEAQAVVSSHTFLHTSGVTSLWTALLFKTMYSLGYLFQMQEYSKIKNKNENEYHRNTLQGPLQMDLFLLIFFEDDESK